MTTDKKTAPRVEAVTVSFKRMREKITNLELELSIMDANFAKKTEEIGALTDKITALEAQLKEATDANDNCISLLLHESRMRNVEAKLALAEKREKVLRDQRDASVRSDYASSGMQPRDSAERIKELDAEVEKVK